MHKSKRIDKFLEFASELNEFGEIKVNRQK